MRRTVAAALSLVTALGVAQVAAATSSDATTAADCSSGAHTLSTYRQHVYPETGNGGYVSVHADVHLVYDAVTNRFLAGNHVALTDRAVQCLTDFSLDFERTSPFADGPDMSVGAVLVNGAPADVTFVQPTYPGDPHGPDDPDPRAHQASQRAVVGGPQHNPLPPACSPELPPGAAADSADGTACPANKMVITPATPIAAGAAFTVTVFYTGRPGVHEDGDGSTEGWFRSDSPAGDGGFVTTEPVGTEDWMPLNDHPSAKPTYDYYDTVTAGRTVLANGILVGHRDNPPSSQFPGGSSSWHWHMSSPVASYLVENSVGFYDLTSRVVDGTRFYEAQASSLSAARKRANLAIMNQQPDITAFQSTVNGPYPFASGGVVVGLPDAGFEEEMEGMITFAGGFINLDVLNHENMHQWWGDNVTEANYNLTFYKEGLATFGEFLFRARNAAEAKGGLSTAAGAAAFEHSLTHQFDAGYRNPRLWGGVPSDPTPYTLFSGSSTYERPGLAYIALRQILGADEFSAALQSIQARFGGSVITEDELESSFAQHLPKQTPACRARLGRFFTQWFDTRYPTAAGAARPSLTGPGLAGDGFYRSSGGC